MPQWTLDEAFVSWLRTTMSPEQVSMLDLNGVLDDIYSGYLAGIAAERARCRDHPGVEREVGVSAAGKTGGSADG